MQRWENVSRGRCCYAVRSGNKRCVLAAVLAAVSSLQATNCEFDIDGERVVCDAPEGVGADFQWAVIVRG